MRDVRKAERGKNRGFTLVELVVVITVLGMLMAILIPQLLGYIDKSKTEAEYAAGENCRVAAQAKLEALQYLGTEPDFNSKGNHASAADIDEWHKAFADPVLEMAGQEVRNLFIATGKYGHYKETADIGPAYRVYFVVYQRSEDSPVVYYDGKEWSDKSPWGGMQESAQIGGDTVFLQYFCLKCETDAAHSTPGMVFTALLGGN